MNVLLRVIGGVGQFYSLHLVISIGKTLVVFWVSCNVLTLIEGLVSPELSKPKGVVLRIALVYI